MRIRRPFCPGQPATCWLRSDLYALAALAGGAVVSAGRLAGVPPFYSMLAGAGVCIFLRLMAIYRGWRAPLPRGGRKS